MQTTATAVSMTEEEYIEFELKSDIRHEYVNGQLIDMLSDSGLRTYPKIAPLCEASRHRCSKP